MNEKQMLCKIARDYHSILDDPDPTFFRDPATWYPITREFINKKGGRKIFRGGKKYIDVLRKNFPEVQFIEWSFPMVSPGFWNDHLNHIMFVRWYLKKNKITDYAKCYNIKNKDICDAGGASLLNIYHKCSIYVLLKNTLLYRFLPWKFTNSPQAFWKDKNNGVRYLKWLKEESIIDTYYDLNKTIFKNHHGSGLLGQYNFSIWKLLEDLLSSDDFDMLDIWRFGQSPKNWADDNKHCKRFMDSLHNTLNLKDPKLFYTVTWKEVLEYGGHSIQKRFGLRSKLYQELYAKFGIWQEELFMNRAADLCGEQGCRHGCFERSIASIDNIDQIWVKNKNPTINILQIFRWSEEKYWLRCLSCDHASLRPIRSLVEKSDRDSCPYCCMVPRLLCDNDECNQCFEKSFASHPYSKNIVDKNINCREIFRGGGTELTFVCPQCCHEFNKKPCHITNINRQREVCPFCSNTLLCNSEKCESCFNKSFASVKESQYIKDDTNPRQYFKSSAKIEIKFQCPECEEQFPKTPNSVYSGHFCPYCRKKTELKLSKFLVEHFKKHTILREFAPEWCKNPETGRCLRFDFCIPELKIIIELDGEQHFKYIPFFHKNYQTFEDRKKRDQLKERMAITNGFYMIRIKQTDVWNDKNDWTKILSKYLISSI